MNKNKNKIKLFVFLFVPLLAGFFTIGKCWAEETLKITNIQYGGETANEDFIEITNLSNEGINLKEGYRLVKRARDAKASTKDTTIKSWSEDTLNIIILSGEKYVWASSKDGEDFPKKIEAKASTKVTITEGNQIALKLVGKDKEIIIDSINWKEDTEPEEEPV